MNDEEYGIALVQELRELSEALVDARRDHEHVADLLKAKRRDHLSLRREVEKRVSHNKALLEQELLKQQIDSKKREKARILKELAAARWNYEVLQRAAGFGETKNEASHAIHVHDVKHTQADGQPCPADESHESSPPNVRRRKPSSLKSQNQLWRRASNLNNSSSSIEAFSASEEQVNERGNQRRRQRSSRNASYSSLRSSSFGDSTSKLSSQGEDNAASMSVGKAKRRTRPSSSSTSFNNSFSSLSTKSSTTAPLRGRRTVSAANGSMGSNEAAYQRRVGPILRSASVDESLTCAQDVSEGRKQRSNSIGSTHAADSRQLSGGDANNDQLTILCTVDSNGGRALNGSKHPPMRLSLDDFSSDEDVSGTDDSR